ncbi:MAG TPA: 4-phosphopantetheinyl transferase [Micromonosporaceae bacterium]|nr:4-phosphopantetheinyl transferase [Micromonosporaceae bacterium]
MDNLESGVSVWLSRTRDARSLAAWALGCSQEDLGREPGGRPTAPGGVHLAMSHATSQAGTVAAVALSTGGAVGVDVEHDRELPAAALAAHWFDPGEADWVQRNPDDFLLLWTQKEAVGKALGVGLRGGGLRRVMPRLQSRHLRAVPALTDMYVAAWRQQDLVMAVACEVPVHFAVFNTD